MIVQLIHWVFRFFFEFGKGSVDLWNAFCPRGVKERGSAVVCETPTLIGIDSNHRYGFYC